MDSIVKAVSSHLPPSHMDFEGQRKAEYIFQVVLAIFGSIGFCCGYAYQQFSMAVYILGVGFIVASLLTLPPWPMYRRNPLKWQPVRSDANTTSASGASGGIPSGKSSRKDK